MIKASPTGLTDQQVGELRAIHSYINQIQETLISATIHQRIGPSSIAAMRLNAQSITTRLDNLNRLNMIAATKEIKP